MCEQQVLEDEGKYKNLWRHIALSVDWNQTYKNNKPLCSKFSSVFFYRFILQKNWWKTCLSPVLWDTQFQTAVAQADVEDRQKQTFYNNIAFDVQEGGQFVISSTRPELLPACVAVAAHPEDNRYKKLFGKYAITPLFKRRVPILASHHANPEKGTGILMVCTFGDMEDVAFCRKQALPTLQIIDERGFFSAVDFTKGLC